MAKEASIIGKSESDPIKMATNGLVIGFPISSSEKRQNLPELQANLKGLCAIVLRLSQS